MSKYARHRSAKEQYDYKMLRKAILNTTACPKCGAKAGEECIGSRGTYRYTLHRERRTAAHISIKGNSHVS